MLENSLRPPLHGIPQGERDDRTAKSPEKLLPDPQPVAVRMAEPARHRRMLSVAYQLLIAVPKSIAAALAHGRCDLAKAIRHGAGGFFTLKNKTV